MSMPSTTANAITKHPEVLNFKSLWNRYMEHHFSELLVRLNTTGLLEKLTVKRLKQGQLKAGSIKCILTDHKLLEGRELKLRNLGVQILQQAKLLGFLIEENDFTRSWNQSVSQVTNDLKIAKILEKKQIFYEESNASRMGIRLIS